MMKRTGMLLMLMCGLYGYGVVGSPAVVCGQDHGHSDIEFAYVDGSVEVEFGEEGNVFEGEFPLTGVDRQFTSEPGFASERAEGLGIGAGDQMVYHVLDSLMFWNGAFQPVPAGVQVRVVNQPPSPIVPDTIVTASSGVQRGPML